MDVTALYRAAGLVERLAGAPDGDGATGDSRRLGRWAAQPPFDQHDWWYRRLAVAGLTESRLRALLAEPAEALAARIAPTPDWVAELTAAYWESANRESANRESANREAETPAGQDDGLPFVGLAEPLLHRARQRLRERIGDGELLDELYRPLPALVDRALTRTMVLELNVARLAGSLSGWTAEDRFDTFCARLRDPAERRRLVSEYPALARRLYAITANWVAASATFAGRLAADAERLAATFGTAGSAVVEVTTGLGDPHRGGHTVASVSFANGARVVYKPRPVAVDVCFQRLLVWLNEHGVAHPLRPLSYIDCGGYGWAEYVAAGQCVGDDELHRFYHRQGSLLALVYLLRGNDLNAENLIAAGEHPMLVDVEALCQPEFVTADPGVPAAERAAIAAATASVLRVGLLPMRAWTTVTGRSVDLSGLGGAPGQLTPMALADVDDAGTDRMHLRLRRRPIEPALNRPTGRDEAVPVLPYVNDILAGFTEAYELCGKHRDELLSPDGPVGAFAGAEVRILLRSTMEYALLRNTGFHPDVVRDGLDTERHFDRLWKGVARRPSLAAVVDHERRDLLAHDIPSFTIRTDAADVTATDGTPIAGLVARTGMDSVRATINALGPEDLHRQRWLIRSSLVTMSIDTRGVDYPSYRMPEHAAPATPDRLLAAADAIGRHLARIAYHERGSAEWLGVVSDRGEDWSLGPLGADLPTGLAGVALFLGQLGSLTGTREHATLARAALTTALSQVDRGLVARVGGVSGLAGIMYAITQLGVLWQDERLLDTAADLAVQVGAIAADDEQYDVAGGSAGSIAALRALYAVRPAGSVLAAVRACGDRILAGRQPEGEPGAGAAWLPKSMIEERVADAPLSGFGHGAAGIAWALLEAAALCGDERYHGAAVAAIGYERTLFDPDCGNWADLRIAFRTRKPDFAAWCHGASGVGMGRALALAHLPDPQVRGEIATAVETTLAIGFGMNHSLCHGDVGNVELLLLAADALGEPAWREEAYRRMGAILDAIDSGGWVTGLPHGIEAPGLLVGLAGTGHGILRLAAPDRVPAVLWLAPHRT